MVFQEPLSSDDVAQNDLATRDLSGSFNRADREQVGESKLSPLNVEVIEKAEAAVDQCRAGKITRSEAVAQLIVALDIVESHADKAARRSAFEQYYRDLPTNSQLEEEAAGTLWRILDESLFKDVGGESAGSTAVVETYLTELAEVGDKRVRDWGGNDEEEYDEERGGKRPKLERDQLPWTEYEDKAAAALEESNPGGSKTRELLRLFSIDPSFVVTDIRLSAGAPAGFPISEWENIVNGSPVNLDIVLSSLHQIPFDFNNPPRVVQSASDWLFAWEPTVRAYAFVFEHRREELDKYGRYILSLFAAKVESAAPRIILYDKAVRNFIEGGQRYSVADTTAYSMLKEAILACDGVEHQRAGGGESKRRGGRCQ